MAIFTGQLNTNAVFASLYNQIISLQVFPTGVSDLSGIYSSRKVDGTLYGDTKLYVSTDALKSYSWNDGSYNLLTKHRPPAPVQQKIVIDIFRQIPVTVDDYLTKQAFESEGSFSAFNGVVLSWLQKTKEIYEHTKFTVDIVSAASASAKALGTIDLKAATLGASPDPYDLIRWRAQELFRRLGDMVKEIGEPERAWNDNGFLRTYSLSDFDIVMPLGLLSTVERHDIPYLFNPDGKANFDIKEVHWKYFVSAVLNADGTSDGTKRAYIEKDFTNGTTVKHLFPGDLIPSGYTYLANEAYTPSYTAAPSLNGTVDITMYLVHKNDFPILSAFSVGTSFFNAKDLDMNHYLTFGHNNVFNAHIGEYALLKVTTDQA